MDKEGIKQYKEDQNESLEYESDEDKLKKYTNNENAIQKILDLIIKQMARFKQLSTFVSFDNDRYEIRLQYCAKVMRENFGESRALFSSKFVENSSQIR